VQDCFCRGKPCNRIGDYSAGRWVDGQPAGGLVGPDSHVGAGLGPTLGITTQERKIGGSPGSAAALEGEATMKVTGGAALNAPVEAVWTALNDPAVLVRTIPGCERLETIGPDSYRLTITTGMAAVRGTYTGEVSLADQQPPGSFTLRASGTGGPGTISTDVRVRLATADDGSTWLSYDADAVVGGVIAGVGQRMLAGVAKRMAEQFFGSVDQLLTGVPESVGPPAGASAGPTEPDRSAGVQTAAALGGAAQAGGARGGAPQAAVSRPAGVFVAPARAGTGAGVPLGFLAAVLAGGAIALAGVIVGVALGRRAIRPASLG
jgi:carbon monoxide dehydrogenase subunit G